MNENIKISLLIPTKGRLDMMKRFVKSALDTADNPDLIEFIAYVENNDSSYDAWDYPSQVKMGRGEKKNLSQCYEWQRASGDIFGLAGDDNIFRTQSWDSKIITEFEKYPDRIVLVHGEDGDPNIEKTNATFPFTSRRWAEVVGRYLPPYFTGDFTDTWLSDVANALGRRVKLDFYIEHIHPAFGKRDQDETDKMKWQNHFSQNMPQKYLDLLPERLEEIEKLKKYIQEFK